MPYGAKLISCGMRGGPLVLLFSFSFLALIFFAARSLGLLVANELTSTLVLSATLQANRPSRSTARLLRRRYRPGHANFRIQRELQALIRQPLENVTVAVLKDIRSWIVTIQGAKGTIYEGDAFRLRVKFPSNYPIDPPRVYFLPPSPRHSHVYSNGDICLNLLGADWKPTMTISTIANAILSMLSSAKEKRLPTNNSSHADEPPGEHHSWVYHDDSC